MLNRKEIEYNAMKSYLAGFDAAMGAMGQARNQIALAVAKYEQSCDIPSLKKKMDLIKKEMQDEDSGSTPGGAKNIPSADAGDAEPAKS